MPDRIPTSLQINCRCGARGHIRLEEDDVPNRMEGNANPIVSVEDGPFTAEGGKLVCKGCGTVLSSISA